jgi:CBS domain-containing protein
MELHRMPASDIMRTDFISVGPKERLDFSDRLMRLGHFRHLPVLEDGRLVGMTPRSPRRRR